MAAGIVARRAELNRMRVAGFRPCGDQADCERHLRCTLAAGHEGRHSASVFEWRTGGSPRRFEA